MHSQGSSHCWKHYRKVFHSSTPFKCYAIEACWDGLLWHYK
ncbi:hypothetical protein A2U01_0013915, partial [Trifolium medium]|nr:hypothetical protein [Trifolium medium]